MSIREEWKRLVKEEELFRLDPFPGDPRTRTVLMTAAVNNLVSGPWDDELMGDRCARLLAALQRVIRGAKLIVCMDPFEAREAQLGRLDPISEFSFRFSQQRKART